MSAGLLKSKLHVQELIMFVRLGCSEEERKTAQKVSLSFWIDFEKLPEASFSDQLSETYCYGEICSSILSHVKDREFKTIERLGFELHALVRESLHDKDKLTLLTHKLHPPVLSLEGGVSFEITG